MGNLPHIEAMLERQARFWEIRRRLAERGGEASMRAMAHLPEGPWITVSSPLGSGGRELAAALAQSLEWQVFDREILSTIAEHTHTQETILAHLDEQAMGPIKDYLTRLFDPHVPGQVPFLREMVRVIWGLAKRGSAVILGRGANWFLDPRFGLRIRAVAPIEVRAARISSALGADLHEARQRAVLHDAQQADFIRQVYKRDVNDPVGYDLVLNLEHVDQQTALHIVLTGLRRRLGSD